MYGNNSFALMIRIHINNNVQEVLSQIGAVYVVNHQEKQILTTKILSIP